MTSSVLFSFTFVLKYSWFCLCFPMTSVWENLGRKLQSMIINSDVQYLSQNSIPWILWRKSDRDQMLDVRVGSLKQNYITERWFCFKFLSFFFLDGDTSLLVYITGTGFSDDSKSFHVVVNKTSCKVIFSNQTILVCQTDLLPVGVHQVSVLMRPSGLAVNASGKGLLLYLEPRLDAVEPSRAAEIGNLGDGCTRHLILWI